MDKELEYISSPGSERAILSIILQNTDKLLEAEEKGLRKEHFSLQVNRYLYSTIAYLTSKGFDKVDGLSIINALDSKGREEVDKLGGIEYIDLLMISELLDNVDLYVEKIKEAYQRRRVYSLCDKAKIRMTNDDVDMAKELDDFQNSLLELSLNENDVNKVHKMGEGLAERLNERAKSPKKVAGYSIGWNNYDKITQGYKAGELTVICAPSKTGKTIFQMNHAIALAVYSKIPTLYINTEMPDDEMEDRLLSCVSGVPYEEVCNGMFSQDTSNGLKGDKMGRIKEALKLIKESPFYHVYMPDFTIEKVTALAKKYKLKHNLGFLIFDYIKLPNSEVAGLQNAQEYQRLGYMTTCLKDLAGVLSIPVLTACQSNGDEHSINGKPTMANIGASKRILHMASKLFFLVNKTEEEIARFGLEYGNQTLYLAYQRSGSCDSDPINLYNEKNILRVSEV